MLTQAASQTQADRIAEYVPMMFMACGFVMLAFGLMQFVQSRATHGWQKSRAEVLENAKPRDVVHLRLDDGALRKAVNLSGRRLKSGKRVWAIVDPDDTHQVRTLPRNRAPRRQSIYVMACGLLVAVIGFALQIVYSAMVG